MALSAALGGGRGVRLLVVQHRATLEMVRRLPFVVCRLPYAH
jgi:hypothetical protein